MREIVVASNNIGKIKEIKDIFSDFNIIGLGELESRLHTKIEINESGTSFSENAIQKATELVNQLDDDILCLADDSGLCIDALNGFPGIRTQRWLDADDHTKNIALLEKMKDVPNNLRTCHYITAIAIANKTINRVAESSLDGFISKEPIGCNGFGFDEIFMLENGKTLAELTSENKYLISPRKKALEEIKEIINTI